LGANEIELADAETVFKATNAKVGFAGPVGLKIKIVVDNQVAVMRNFIVGANTTDVHLKNVNIKDFIAAYTDDVRQIKVGDICPECKEGHVTFSKGIEIGNTFKLGDKYAKALGLEYLDADNKLHPVVMGSYGIGPGRCLAALVEQKHDDKGILWPRDIAPYQVAIVVINTKVEMQSDAAAVLYTQLKEHGYDVLLDDRDERAGVKFNDMDLIGIPLRITVGKTIENKQVEIKARNENDVKIVDVDDVYQTVKEFFQR
jgi:prolyl-tRNA synthetase